MVVPTTDQALGADPKRQAGGGDAGALVHRCVGLRERGIAPPVAASAIWQAEGSASLSIVPGSHLSGKNPGADVQPEGAVTIELEPGDALLVDGRLWVEPSSAAGVRVHYEYTGPQFRTKENNVLATQMAALEAMDEQQVDQLGFRVWFSYGGSHHANGPKGSDGHPMTRTQQLDGDTDRVEREATLTFGPH